MNTDTRAFRRSSVMAAIVGVVLAAVGSAGCRPASRPTTAPSAAQNVALPGPGITFRTSPDMFGGPPLTFGRLVGGQWLACTDTSLYLSDSSLTTWKGVYTAPNALELWMVAGGTAEKVFLVRQNRDRVRDALELMCWTPADGLRLLRTLPSGRWPQIVFISDRVGAYLDRDDIVLTTDGGVNWSKKQIKLGPAEQISALAFSADRCMLAGTSGGQVVALDLKQDGTLAERWRVAVGAHTIYDIGLDGDVALVKADDLTAHRVSDGEPLWRLDQKQIRPEVDGKFCVCGDLVFAIGPFWDCWRVEDGKLVAVPTPRNVGIRDVKAMDHGVLLLRQDGQFLEWDGVNPPREHLLSIDNSAFTRRKDDDQPTAQQFDHLTRLLLEASPQQSQALLRHFAECAGMTARQQTEYAIGQLQRQGVGRPSSGPSTHAAAASQPVATPWPGSVAQHATVSVNGGGFWFSVNRENGRPWVRFGPPLPRSS